MSAATEPQEPRRAWARIRRVLQPAMAVLALVFVAWAARDLAQRWQGGSVQIRWGYLVLSSVPLAASGCVLAWSWKSLLERMAGKPVALGPALALHAESQLARYVPGKVGIPVVRMNGAKGLGIAASTVGSSIAIELLSFVAVGGATGLGLLSLTAADAAGVVAKLGRWAPAVVVVLVLAVVALIAVDRRRFPRALVAAAGLAGAGPLVPRRLPLLHVVYWLGWAVHGGLVVVAAGGSGAAALGSSGLFVIAPIVGFLALAAPAGVGVREAVLSIGLAPAVGAAPALAALIISRAVTLVVDLVVWLALRPLRAR